MPEAVQQPGEEAPRKRIAGTDLLDHAKAQRGHVDPLATLKAGDRVGVILDNEVLGLGEERPQPRRILSSEHRERFVGANEDDVAAPNVAREHLGCVRRARGPQRRPIVQIEADQPAASRHRNQVIDQPSGGFRQRGGDSGGVRERRLVQQPPSRRSREVGR